MVQISRRGKAYLETARTLLRAAKNMTDQAIAGRLKALAEDYQRRAEKASHADAARAFARLAEAPHAPDHAPETFEAPHAHLERGHV